MSDITKSKLQGEVSKAKRKKLTIKKVIVTLIVLLIIGAASFGIWTLFIKEEEKIALTSTTMWGALDRSISGSGTTAPAESVSVSVVSSADIEEVYVKVGDIVEEGQLLYKQDDSAIDEQISDIEEQIEGYYDEISEYESSISSLYADIGDYKDKKSEYSDNLEDCNEAIGDAVITAEFSGKISGITAEVGKKVNSGTVLATLTDETVMEFSQYYSYAYEDSIKIGMNASVTVNGILHEFDGKVCGINKIEWISDEGMKCLEVTVEIRNPGSLTDKNTASAVLHCDSGMKIYPVKDGSLKYKNTASVTSPATGEILNVYAVNYGNVTSGQKLFEIDTDTYLSQIESAEKQIESTQTQIDNAYKQIENYQNKITSAQEKIESATDSIAELEESRSDYLVTSEISGKVMYVNVEAGERPNMMAPAVTVYNLDTMTISVNLDELDIDYVSEGTPVTVTRAGAESSKRYNGTITYISPEATSSGGVATFAATIEINSKGELSSGVSVSYTVAVGDSEEGVLAPISALRSVGDEYYLFVKSDRCPDNAVDLDQADAEVPNGFFAVPVEVGNSNAMYVKIISGVDKDTEVFTRYRQTAPGNSSTTSKGDEEDSETDNPFGSDEMPSFGGNMPSFGGNYGGNGSNRPSMNGGTNNGTTGGSRGGR